MQVSATIGAKSAEKGARPDRAKLEEMANELRRCGFEVLRVGRFGVSVTGDESTFAEFLGVEAKPDEALSVPARPAGAALRDMVGTVEVVPRPQLY
jgi:hypothetical protein